MADLHIADERGAALVEFALVLPVLLLLLFGMLDFGRAINYWIDETHLANAAARWAAVNYQPSGGGDICSYVQGQADTGELRDGGTSSVPDPATVSVGAASPTGQPVTATVSVNYNWLPILNLGIATTTMTATATMRLEAQSFGGCSA